MALTKTPSDPYPVASWLKKPRNVTDGQGYDKYKYKNGESLASIAGAVSTPDKSITWQDLTNFNWGTATPTEVNYYLGSHTGCKYETSDGYNYRFSEEDKNPFIWVPKAEPELPPIKYRSPGKVDVGHVALDDESEKHINTLVIRPAYTITLKLADVDALFETDSKGDFTKTGRKQRLQALGYLYRPLKHKKIDEAFDKVWEHYRKLNTKKGSKAPTDPELDAILKKEVRSNIMSVVGDFPTKLGQIHDGRLPRKGEFAAIRLPGGFCYNRGWFKAREDHDASYEYRLNEDRHKVEDAFYKDNELLGKIPIVANVQRIRPDGKAEPAEGVSVYFQLIKPDELKKGNKLRAPDLGDKVMDKTNDRSVAPHNAKPDADFLKDGGPKKFVDDNFKPGTDADDPQQNNAPEKIGPDVVGGKRDLPVAENIFEVHNKNARAGLHTPKKKHEDYGKLKMAQPVEPVDGEHKHAVRAKTNEKGYAGVVFMPSRIGGDNYKIRAYVGPESLEFAGDDEEGPVMDTGTMVVWRNIRLYRYIQMKVGGRKPNNVSSDVSDMLKKSDKNHPPLPNGTYTVAQAWTDAKLNKEIPTIDLDSSAEGVIPQNAANWFGHRFYRPVDVTFLHLVEQYRRNYCEFIIENQREDLTSNELKAAYTVGLKALEDHAGLGNIKWEKLIFHDWTSPFLLNIRAVKHYEKLRWFWQKKIDSSNWGNVRNAIKGVMIPAMMDHFSGGGVLPGLTIVQVPRGDTWEFISQAGHILTSGVGLAERGAFLSYTSDIYTNLCYSVTANAAHELGHVMVRQHAPPAPGAGPQPDCHQAQAECICVMSYAGCFGEYCGRCGLALRGWRVRNSKSGTVSYNAV